MTLLLCFCYLKILILILVQFQMYFRDKFDQILCFDLRGDSFLSTI